MIKILVEKRRSSTRRQDPAESPRHALADYVEYERRQGGDGKGLHPRRSEHSHPRSKSNCIQGMSFSTATYHLMKQHEWFPTS